MKLTRKVLQKLIIAEMRIGRGFDPSSEPRRNEIYTNVRPNKTGQNLGVHFILKSYIPYDYDSVKYMWYKDCTKRQMAGVKGRLALDKKQKDWQAHALANEPDDYDIVKGADGELHRVPVKKDLTNRFSEFAPSKDPTVYEIMGPYDNETIDYYLNNPNYKWPGKVSRFTTYKYD